jgi:hypothetical protein
LRPLQQTPCYPMTIPNKTDAAVLVPQVRFLPPLNQSGFRKFILKLF